LRCTDVTPWGYNINYLSFRIRLHEKAITAPEETSKSGLKLLEDVLMMVFPNDDASGILRELFASLITAVAEMLKICHD
jgi:hypothetical protein